MPSEQSRVECLRLAHERLGPTATIEELFDEARHLLAFVEGLDMPVRINGELMHGKRV